MLARNAATAAVMDSSLLPLNIGAILSSFRLALKSCARWLTHSPLPAVMEYHPRTSVWAREADEAVRQAKVKVLIRKVGKERAMKASGRAIKNGKGQQLERHSQQTGGSVPTMGFCTTGTPHKNLTCAIPVVIRAGRCGHAPHGDN